MAINLEKVLFVNPKETSMILDTGCPSTLAGNEILDRYIEENDLDYDNLEKKGEQI